MTRQGAALAPSTAVRRSPSPKLGRRNPSVRPLERVRFKCERLNRSNALKYLNLEPVYPLQMIPFEVDRL